MKLKKYFTLTKIGILDGLQFRLSLLVMVFGNLLYLTLIYFLWKSIYASAGCEVVNGMTFEGTMIYLVLASALYNFMEMYIVWYMGRNIQSGKIVLELLKPLKYKNYMFWTFSGNLIVNFFATFLPTFIVVMFVTKGIIPIGMNLLYFVIGVILAVIINFNIDFLIGTVCLYTESIWGINIMKQVIVSLLSGATIPLAFFPDKVRDIVNYLPFRAIYDTPLTLLINRDCNSQYIISKLGFSLIWAIGISIITTLFWKISVKKITVNGG